MNFLTFGGRIAATLLIATFMLSRANATPISITNADFSNQTLSTNTYQNGIAGWTGTNNYGVTRLASSTVVTPADYPQTAFVNSGSISQTLSATLQQGVDYTMSFFYVARSDDPFASAVIELLAQSTVLSSISVGTGTMNPVTLGASAQETLSYSSIDPSLSGALRIEVLNTTSSGQVDVTGFALDGSPSIDVPEPATFALLGVGLVGIAAFRRKLT